MATSDTTKEPLIEVFRNRPGTERADAMNHLTRMIESLRRHMGMDVSFVSQFVDGLRVFRYVDAGRPDQPVKVGGADPLEESYCQRVIDGRLPQLIRDATQNDEALTLPVTRALPVGAHLSVPIVLGNGELYGTLCCFSFTPDMSLTPRDLSVMRVFSELIAEFIDTHLERTRRLVVVERRIREVLDGEQLSMVFQPIHDIATHSVIGYESLTRFTASPQRTPDIWFTEAASVGLGVALELKAVELALRQIRSLGPDCYVSVNVSPDTILDDRLAQHLRDATPGRVVLEITEHMVTDRYEDISRALGSLRESGMRLAVDDAGAGYASFRHILRLSPDIIKLDMSITRDIDKDASRQALARAFVSFADSTDCTLVAEGVESDEELSALRDLGVGNAQGYLLGKPRPLGEVVSGYS